MSQLSGRSLRQELQEPLNVVRLFGIRWTILRLLYEFQERSGVLAWRFPTRTWDKDELARWTKPGIPHDAEAYAHWWYQNHRPFFFSPEAIREYCSLLREIQGEQGVKELIRNVNDIYEGRFRYFEHDNAKLGLPPNWHLSPFTGQGVNPRVHWSRIPVYSLATGDIKFIWEPARFASAYTLARAYWVQKDERYAETFWRLVESWGQANPPNAGPHWRCGQEISLRLIAWIFALYAFADSPCTTPERLKLIVGMIAAQANRIARNHIYAWLQRNNHAISEGVALWTVGLLFPELRHAKRWRAQGRRILTYEAGRQIAADGSYIQNSTNYHRLMLQDYLWAARLGEVCGDPLPDSVLRQIRQAVEFLYQMQDSESGQVPCYGHNDGALVLPLNTCDYTDFRPVLAAGHYLVHRTRLYEPGPWEEDLLWFFGPEALKAPVQTMQRSSFAAPEGGYYVLRGERSFAFTRCTTYCYRPSQADMLHLDLWWRGVNVACDPGTYRYYAEPPWDNGLVGTAVHNTVTVGGQDQMIRGPRFLWFDWIQAEMLAFQRSPHGNLDCFQGQHSGYLRLRPPLIHRRAVLRSKDDVWVVVDDLIGSGSHPLVLHWLLFPGNYVLDEDMSRLGLTLPIGDLHLYWSAWRLDSMHVDISCGNETKAPRGWRSRYYGVREPALSFRIAGYGRMPCRLVSVFLLGADAQHVSFESERVVVHSNDEMILSLMLSPLHSSDRLSLEEARIVTQGQVETLRVI